MIVAAKFTLFIIWLVAFVITCLLVGFAFPLIVVADKSHIFLKNVPLLQKV